MLVKIHICILLLIGTFILTGCNHNCENDPLILESKKEGQIILNQVVKELNEELNNPNLSKIDKIKIINKKVNSSIDWADKKKEETKCYGLYEFRDDFNKTKLCKRWKKEDLSPSFIVFNHCGACEEYARLNYYLLNSFGFKSRIVAKFNKSEDIHIWNEIFLNGRWVDNDASVYPSFKFNDSSAYENPPSVLVIEGEGKCKDISLKYNKENPLPKWKRLNFQINCIFLLFFL